MCCFLIFLRDDSAPLASERLGEPGRLSALDGTGFLSGPACFPGRWGVLVPFVEAPDDGLDGLAFSTSDSAVFLSFSFLRSSSFKRSVSVSSDSDYELVSRLACSKMSCTSSE